MVEPFLKWAGGKRWLAAAGLLPIPQTFTRLVEPFVGGGAVFFSLRPKKAILSDVNPELIHLYQQIKSHPVELYQRMLNYQSRHSKRAYYKVRAETPVDDLERAARFLYLNRTCWNGLYRVNLKGVFNVPIGTKDTVVFADESFLEISKTLVGAILECSDFEAIIDRCGAGDFLFADPPYTANHNYNGFLKYNEKIFSWTDQIRLRNALLRARSRGVAIAVTNADHESIHDLYVGLGEYRKISRSTVLAADKARRGKVTEALYYANIEQPG